jgi:hypothetical protein
VSDEARLDELIETLRPAHEAAAREAIERAREIRQAGNGEVDVLRAEIALQEQVMLHFGEAAIPALQPLREEALVELAKACLVEHTRKVEEAEARPNHQALWDEYQEVRRYLRRSQLSAASKARLIAKFPTEVLAMPRPKQTVSYTASDDVILEFLAKSRAACDDQKLASTAISELNTEMSDAGVHPGVISLIRKIAAMPDGKRGCHAFLVRRYMDVAERAGELAPDPMFTAPAETSVRPFASVRSASAA